MPASVRSSVREAFASVRARDGSVSVEDTRWEAPPPLGGWTGKTGKDPHEHWSKCMFQTGNVSVRTGKGPVRRLGLEKQRLRMINRRTQPEGIARADGGSPGINCYTVTFEVLLAFLRI